MMEHDEPWTNWRSLPKLRYRGHNYYARLSHYETVTDGSEVKVDMNSGSNGRNMHIGLTPDKLILINL